MEKVVLSDKLAQITEHWRPYVVGQLNGQEVKLVKFKGEFVWHHHDDTDELFLVVAGAFDMQYRDRTVRVQAGEFVIVPRGMEHCPKAEEEVSILLFERAEVVNTGSAAPSALTAERREL